MGGFRSASSLSPTSRAACASASARQPLLLRLGLGGDAVGRRPARRPACARSAPCWTTSSSSRRASSIWFCSSFSAIARSRSTASARRSNVARSASCWTRSRVWVCRARSSSARPGWRRPGRRSPRGRRSARRGSAASVPARPGRAPARCRGPAPRHRHAGELVEGRLLGQLGEQAAELSRAGWRRHVPGVGVDAEVDAGGRERRVDDPVGDGGLDGDVLEVGGPGVEQQLLLPVVERDLGSGRPSEGRNQKAWPGPVVLHLAVAQVQDVSRGVGS